MMNSRFASAVDPILSHSLDLIARIESGGVSSPEEERVVLLEYFQNGRIICGYDRRWDLASYAIAAWIDEMLVELPWSGAGWWSNNVLEMELFQSRECSEKFFELARQATAIELREALEVFVDCVVLGFRGMYANAQSAKIGSTKLGLPATLEHWLQQTRSMVQYRPHEPVPVAQERVVSGAVPFHARQQVIVWSLAMVILLAANLAIFQLY